MFSRQQNSTTYPIQFFLSDNFDRVTGATGVIPYINLSKNGGSFSSAAGAISEIGRGWYSFTANATDRDTLGELVINVSGLNVDNVDTKINITPYDQYNGNYYADIVLERDTVAAKDEYTVSWFKGPEIVTAVTTAYVNVVKRADGTDLVASTPLSAIGSTGALKYDESTNRTSVGESYIVITSGTIDGAVRVWRRIVSRDS